MLGIAALPLGIELRFLDPAPNGCASAVGEQIVGAYDDPEVIGRFCEGLDVVTYEFENVSAAALEQIARHAFVWPPISILEVSQDRLSEKECMQSLGIGTAGFQRVDTEDDLDRALGEIGLPAVLKTRRMGYDGKGQAVVRTVDEATAAFAELGRGGLILESLVPFDRELSIIAVRSMTGEFRAYPLVQNTHRAGILRTSIAPAPDIDSGLQAEAESISKRIADKYGHVGVLTVELFDVGGKLLVNELAPRVHNSGHWSIEGAVTSQFENHVRAVAGLPLGSTRVEGEWTMANLIGGVPPAETLLGIAGAQLHLYGKSERPGRKLGHVTVRTDRPGGPATAQEICGLADAHAL